MTTGGGHDRSAVELREAVIGGWHRLVTNTQVQSSADPLRTLVDLTGIPFRQLDMARQVRNKIAHPDQPVSRERLQAALRTIEEAELRLTHREPKPHRSGQPATRKAAKQVVGPTTSNRSPAIGFQRLILRQPARRQVIPRDQGGAPAQRDGAKPQTGSRHLQFHCTAGERSAPQLIPLSDLGISTRGWTASVNCDVPWLYGAIVGDAVRLIAAPLEPDSKQSGSAWINTPDGSVKITVDAYTRPPTSTTTPTSNTITIGSNIPPPPRPTPTSKWNTFPKDGITAAVFVALVICGLILLFLLIGLLA